QSRVGRFLGGQHRDRLVVRLGRNDLQVRRHVGPAEQALEQVAVLRPRQSDVGRQALLTRRLVLPLEHLDLEDVRFEPVDFLLPGADLFALVDVRADDQLVGDKPQGEDAEGAADDDGQAALAGGHWPGPPNMPTGMSPESSPRDGRGGIGPVSLRMYSLTGRFSISAPSSYPCENPPPNPVTGLLSFLRL